MSETEKDIAKAWLPLQCPKCGGELGGRSAGRFTCPYCGTSFLPAGIFAGKAVDLQRLYEWAYAEAEAGHYGQAQEYFERILEADPGEYQAWFGKAISGAYAYFNETGQIKADEVLWCMNMALAYYDGDDKDKFRSHLANRVGALAVDLTQRVKNNPVYDESILRTLLDLLAYWEERGTEEFECWTATVAAAATPVRIKDGPSPVTTALLGPVALLSSGPTIVYPFAAVAQEYREKIRAKYGPPEQKDTAPAEHAPPVKSTPAWAPEEGTINKNPGTNLITVAIIALAVAVPLLFVIAIIISLVGGS